ncbi:cysteinyl-tRNA synthetase, variant, partial [Sphaeroforma arctica JP610]
MTDYFGYRLFHVMNITDIDDKIILRARRNHLFNLYTGKNLPKDELMKDLATAMAPFEAKAAKEEEPAKKEMYTNVLSKIASLKAVAESSDSTAEDLSALLEGAKDPISEWQDALHGAEVTDNDIFSKLSAFWEADYMEDMDALKVLPPDCLTRVSEYVPEIVEYVEKIIANGYGYESQGSVYFDVKAFDANPLHDYAKCVPEAANDLGLLAEGEGALSSGGVKKSPQDFALWKASKPGEPSWASPWGKGRPGWHIECSAMASDVIPGKLDVHCGGMDLMFPHHDNEIAQAEAYYGCRQWVNYFLHAGHLEIEGRKMSKSLKNFITIKEALSRHSARQLRLMFLSHSWGGKLDYSENTMTVAIHTEKVFNEFFLNVKSEMRQHTRESKFGTAERTLHDKIVEAETNVHNSLCDNIDTPQALKDMKKLVSDVNAYLLDDTRTPSPALLGKAARYVFDRHAQYMPTRS